MSKKRPRYGFTQAAFVIVAMMPLGGCTHSNSMAWDSFVTDLLRNVTSALLL